MTTEDIENICLLLAEESESFRSSISRELPLPGASEILVRYRDSIDNSKIKLLNARKEALQKQKIDFISFFHTHYPEKLRLSPSPPLGLFVKGTISTKPTIAIVGARAASPTACELARRWARELSQQNLHIVSGLALGVDGAAHRGALDSRISTATTAALAHGLDQIYPTSHAKLADEILSQGGAIISEYPLQTPPLKHHFLDRNRIIAGISDITILIQAAERSGALATVRHALELNREVGVVPWDPLEKRGVGGNKLLKEGAHLITKVEDILELLPFYEQNEKQPMENDNPILQFLREKGCASVEEIQTALGQILVNETTILELELDNLITRTPGDLLTLTAG